MKTVLTGTHQPDQPQPKRSRRSPKKRRAEKSEVATPEFGTISSAKPSHGETTRSTETTKKQVTGKIPDRAYPLAEEASVYVAHKEYQRELGKARSRKQQWLERERTNAMRAGFAVGSVLGLIVGLGVWWLSVLFS